MMNQTMRMKTRDAVQMILEAFAGFETGEAAALAGAIDEKTREACLMIAAAEARCAKACEAMLTDNPSRDMTDADELLARELYRLDAYMDDSQHGRPSGKNMGTPFWSTLAVARQALGEGRSVQLPQAELKALLSELMTRNALYQALDDNAMDARDAAGAKAENLVPEETHRACAYAAAVLMKNAYSPEEDELALLMLKICLVYRLDYLDRGKIEKTDAGLAILMERRAEEEAAKQENEPDEADEKASGMHCIKLLPLCAAALTGAAAMKLFPPVGAAAGAAAAALAYLILC